MIGYLANWDFICLIILYKKNRSFVMDLEQTSLIKTLEDQFTCPIYKVPIQNPVITPVGITYERQALEEWLDVNGVEPQSKKPLDKNNLIQNLALKGLASKIYKEVPKLERSLTEKDEIIANLTEEVAQLKKALQSEKEKNQENEELMECTLEKTKKIRKIHERTNNENEMEIIRLRRKVNDLSKLKQQLRDANVKQKMLYGEITDEKNLATRLNKELIEARKAKQISSDNYATQLAHSQAYRSALRQFESECYKNQKCHQRHMQYIWEYLFDNIGQISRKYQQNGITSEALQQMINQGVDQRMEDKKKSMLDKCNDLRRNNLVQKITGQFKNKTLIHRYLMKRRMQEEKTQRIKFHHVLVHFDKSIGYKLEFFPYSVPPTEQELEIDWSQTIRLVLADIDDRKWQMLMSQIHKFPRLIELQINNCTIQNLTESQLSTFRELKFLKIMNWTTLNENLEREMTNYQNNNQRVMVVYENERMHIINPFAMIDGHNP